MPIITIQTIKGVVLTSDEQKRDLLKKMTDTFISVVGELARPYTYCLIQETPLYEWSLAGVPLPPTRSCGRTWSRSRAATVAVAPRPPRTPILPAAATPPARRPRPSGPGALEER
jgi:phenylpyruvate tautomerase PptA (4-oxalocrotonate tautomerase family)